MYKIILGTSNPYNTIQAIIRITIGAVLLAPSTHYSNTDDMFTYIVVIFQLDEISNIPRIEHNINTSIFHKIQIIYRFLRRVSVEPMKSTDLVF